MKKILYFLPFVLGFILYIFLGIVSSFGTINPFVWVALILLLIAGLLMNKNKWWGCIFGIVMCIYYIVCALVSYKKS